VNFLPLASVKEMKLGDLLLAFQGKGILRGWDSNPVKGTWLGWIRQVEIQDEFWGIPEFRCKDP